MTHVAVRVESLLSKMTLMFLTTNEGLLIHGEGGGYESVNQNDSDVSDDDKFSELHLFHADIQVALHNSLFYFSFII